MSRTYICAVCGTAALGDEFGSPPRNVAPLRYKGGGIKCSHPPNCWDPADQPHHRGEIQHTGSVVSYEPPKFAETAPPWQPNKIPTVDEVMMNLDDNSTDIEHEVRDPRAKSKPRICLVPPSFILAVAEVFTKGAHGREDFDWLHPPKPYSESLDAVERHILAYRDGVTHDEKTGLPPLWHAAARLAMVIEYEHLGLDNNDLYNHQHMRQTVQPLAGPHCSELAKDLHNSYLKAKKFMAQGGKMDISAVQARELEDLIAILANLTGD